MYKRFMRRFLPFILSVAMTVEMVPVTAFASELPEQEAVAEYDAEGEYNDIAALGDPVKQLDTEIRVSGYNPADIPSVKVPYNGGNDALNAVKGYGFHAYINGKEAGDEVDEKIVFRWQKAAPDAVWKDIYPLNDSNRGSWEDMAPGEEPAAVGKYLYIADLEEEAGKCGEASVQIPCEIVKKKLIVDYKNGEKFSVLPATKVGDFIRRVDEQMILRTEDDPADLRGTFIASCTISVKKKIGDKVETAGANEEFESKVDYLCCVELVLKDSLDAVYEIDDMDAYGYSLIGRKVIVGDPAATKIEIKDKNGNDLTIDPAILNDQQPYLDVKIYDGQPISIKNDVLPLIDGCIQVLYDADSYPDTPPLWEPLTDDDNAKTEKLIDSMTWWDSGCNYSFGNKAPSDAGLYSLCITYGGKARAYQPSGNTFIRVRIRPADIYIKLLPLKDVFYTGMTEQEVLSRIRYEVWPKDGERKLKAFTPDTFWGVVDSAKGQSNQAYAPVFTLKYAVKDATGDWETENGKIVYRDNCGDELSSERKYIVAFSGNKAVFDVLGNIAVAPISINERSTNSACGNYNVLVDRKTLEENVADVEVKPAAKTKVDVTGILKDGKGGSYDDPIVFVCGENSIYRDSSKYKKAIVVEDTGAASAKTVAEETDRRITYRWQEEIFKDEYEYLDGAFSYGSGGNDSRKLPSEAGRYRLEVTFEDAPEYVYAKSVGYVYYEIQPQFVSVVLEDALKAYTGTDVAAFLDKWGSEVSYAVYPLTDNIYEPVPDRAERPIGLEAGKDYSISWHVERSGRNAGGTSDGVYERLTGSDRFEEGYFYQLTASLTFRGQNDGRYADHYSVGNTDVCFNVPMPIAVERMGAIEVKLEINKDRFSFDPARSGQTYKVYDGEETVLSNIDELITVKGEDGQEIANFPKDQIEITWYVTYEDGKTVEVPAPRNAGSYTMSVYFPGNGVYNWTEEEDEQDTEQNICRIDRKVLTITPVAKDVIKAGGNFAPAVDFPVDGYHFDGVVPSDLDTFRENIFAHSAVTSGKLAAAVYETNRDAAAKTADQKYRSGVDYYAQTNIDAATHMAVPYCYNYKVINARAVHRAERVGAQICSADIRLREETVREVRRVIPNEGLPYYYAGDLLDEFTRAELKEGNYFVFGIQVPKEFDDPDGDGKLTCRKLLDGTVLFRNAIENAGGKVVGLDKENGKINVAFYAESNTKNAKFTIDWQPGQADPFSEAFEVVLKEALLCSDTSKAVLPKSMKFNGAKTKMAVGDVQQLNLTVVKKQVADVIRIGYSVSDSTVLSVTKNGNLTALKKGKAVVSAYPVRIINGREVKIPGGKPLDLSVTVGDVAKPSITKVTAVNNVLKVQYKDLANGYRREFYVLEGKKTAQDFEDILEGKTVNARGDKLPQYINNNWRGVFAIAPVFGDGVKDEKTKVRIQSLGDDGADYGQLEYNKEYTVYVRNVSGVRTLYDESRVASSAAGAAKTILTTKININALNFEMDRKYAADAGADYEVDFSEGFVLAEAYGMYYKYSETTGVETDDLVKKLLPLSKEEQETYINPKTSFFVTDVRDDYYDDAKQAKANGYTLKIGSRYYAPTKIATIDKKGKLTLKGLGTVRVRLYDSAMDIMCSKDVRITAKVNGFAGKNGKTAVGQKLDLSTLLTYQVDGKKITGYPMEFAAPAAVRSNASGWFIDEDGMFVAKKPGKYTVSIEDDVIKENNRGSAKISVTVNVADMEPVKNLKSVFVYDAYAKIRFTYNSQAYYAEKPNGDGTAAEGVDFRVDVRDADGRLINSQILDGMKYAIDGDKVREYHYLVDGLSRRSSYKVSVTALYGDQKSKPVVLSLKTTGVPASYVDMDDIYEYDTLDHFADGRWWFRRSKVPNALNGYYNIDGNLYEYLWNEPESLPADQIKYEYQGVHLDTWGLNEYVWELDEYPFFTSGSTYILKPREDDLGRFKASYLYPKEAMSDTLVWTVKDKKIATVKTLSGSFSAKLQALTPGVTTLEVKSKNTNKVISRYMIKVKAVGDGHDFFGDYDDYYNDVQWDPTYEKSVEMLYVGNPLTIEQSNNEYVWVYYEAKENGVHIFGKDSGSEPDTIKICDQTKYGKDTKWTFANLMSGVYLYEGMRLYMRVEGDITNLCASCIPTVGMVNDTLEVDGPLSMTFSYTAPDDGCYSFTSDVNFFDNSILQGGNGMEVAPLSEDRYKALVNEVQVLAKKGDIIRMRVKGTDETKKRYTIRVKAREYAELSSDKVSVELERRKNSWFKYTAQKDGGYVFTTSEASASLSGAYYESLDRWVDDASEKLENDGTGNIAQYRVEMQEGETRAFCLTTNAAAATAKVSMTEETMFTLKANEPLEVPVSGTGSVVWVKFKVPKTDYYEWNMLTRAMIGTEYQAYYRENSITAEKKEFRELSGQMLNKDTVIYLTIESLTAEQKTFTLYTSRVEGKDLTEDGNGVAEDQRDDVTDGQELWYSFRAPMDGVYGFRITKTSQDSRSITVDEYESVGDTDVVIKVPALDTSGISVHRMMEEGETAVFKVSASSISNPNTKTSVSVRVSRCIFGAPGEGGAFTIDEDGYGHYMLSITENAAYDVLVKESGTGSFDIVESYRMDVNGKLTWLPGLTKNVTLSGAVLKKGEALCFILKQTDGNVPATGTISARKITADKDGEHVENTIPMEANETRWLSYRVNRDGRYYIEASAPDGCNVTWHDAYDDGMPHEPDQAVGDVFRAGKILYLEVTNGAVAGDVFLTIERVEPKALLAGTVGAAISTGSDDHTWYQFSSPETAYYQFTYKVTGGAGTCDYYETVQSTGDHIKELENGKSHIIFMEMGDSIDFHFYDASGRTDAVMTVGKIVADGTITADSEEDVSVTLSSAGGPAWYYFEAKADGNYTFNTTNTAAAGGQVDVSYYLSDSADPAPNNRAIFMPASFAGMAMPLKQGDKVLIRLTTDADEIKVDVNVGTESMRILTLDAPITDMPVDGGAVAWVKFVVPESGRYGWTLATSAVKGTDYEAFYRKNSVIVSKREFDKLPGEVLKQGDTVYITIESRTNSQKMFTLSVTKLDDKELTPGGNGVAEDLRENVADGKELWYIFTASDYGFYEFCMNIKSGTGNIDVNEYERPGDTTTKNTLPRLTANGEIVHRLLEKNQQVIFKIAVSNAVDPANLPTVSVKIAKCVFGEPGENGAIEINTGKYGHYRVPVETAGIYSLAVTNTGGSFELVGGAYRANATGRLTGLAGFSIGNTLTNVSLGEKEALYFIFKENGGSIKADGKIELVKVSDTGSGTGGNPDENELAGGTEKTDTFTDGQERWYTFTASEFGFYEYCIMKTSGDSRPISVQDYEHVGDTTPRGKSPLLQTDGTVVHRVMNVGEKAVFKLSAGTITNPSVMTSVSVKVSKCVFEKPGTGGAIAVGKGSYGHYMLEAAETGKYNILVKKNDGSAGALAVEAYREDLTTKLTGLAVGSTQQNVSMRKDECLYFLLKETTGTNDAAGTITADLVENLGNGGNIDEEVTLDENESRWFTYQVKQAGRYYISASGTCEVYWGDSCESAVTKPDTQIGNVFGAGRTIYIKVSNGAGAQSVNLSIKKVSPVSLSESTVYSGISMKPADRSWYNFKASEDGYYLFDYTVTAGAAKCNYYNVITAGANPGGEKIGELTGGTGRIISMNAGDSYDLHFYDESALDSRKATIKVSRVVPEEIIAKDPAKMVTLTPALREKWYRFTALDDGDYTLEITGATAAMDVTYFTKGDSASIYNAAAESPLTRRYSKDEEVLIRLTTNAAYASAQVRMVAGEMKELLGDGQGNADDTWTDITAGQERWYTFSAPAYGFYEFGISKTGTRRVSVTEYDDVNGSEKHVSPALTLAVGSTIHRLLAKGERVVFMIAGDDTASDAKATVTVTVSKCEFKAPDADGKVTVEPGKFGHYQLTGLETGTYGVLVKSSGELGEVHAYRGNLVTGIPGVTEITGLTKNVTKDDVTIGQNESLYFILGQNSGAADAVGTITADRLTNFGSVGNTDEEVTLAGKESRWFTYQVKQAGRYYISASEGCTVKWGYVCNESEVTEPNARTGNVFAAGRTIYIKVSNPAGTQKTTTLSIKKISPVSINAGVPYTNISMKTEDYSWYNFKAAEDGYYLIDYATTGGTAKCNYYNVITTGNYPDGEKIDALEQGRGTSRIISMSANEAYDIHFDDGASDYKASIKISKITPVEISVGDPAKTATLTPASREVWYQFKAQTGGDYTLEITGATDMQVSYFTKEDAADIYNANGESPLTRRYSKDEEVLIRLTTNAAYASAQVRMVAGEMKELLGDGQGNADDTWTDITAGQERWYTFSAPAYGFYEFGISKTGTRSVSVTEYDDVNGSEKHVSPALTLAVGSTIHRLLAKGEKVVFKIAGNNAVSNATATVTVTVSKCEFEAPGADGKVTVEPGKFGHYQLTASESGLYNVLVKQTNASGTLGNVIVYRDELATRGSEWTEVKDFTVNGIREGVAVAKEESLYFILGQNSGAVEAEGIITMNAVNHLGSGGSVHETVPKGKTSWYSYNVKWNGRYYIDISGTGSEQCNVTLYNKGQDNNLAAFPAPNNNTETGNVFHAGKTVYIKVDNPTANDVTLNINRVLPGLLQADSATRMETKTGEHSWYQFTATKDGYYLFDYTKSSGSATCNYYEAVTADLEGGHIARIDNGNGSGWSISQAIYMEKDQSFDFHFCEAANAAGSKGSIKIKYMADAVSEITLYDEKNAALSSADKLYSFTATAAGDNYTCISNAENVVDVQYFIRSMSKPGDKVDAYTMRPVNDSYLQLAAGEEMLMKICTRDAGARDVKFSLIDQKIIEVTPTRKLERTDTSKPTYIRLAEVEDKNERSSSGLYYIESDGSSGYWCQMDAFGTTFGGENREIFNQVSPDKDFDKIYKVTGSACTLSLSKIYKATLDKPVDVQIEKGYRAYIRFDAPYSDSGESMREFYAFIRGTKKMEVRDVSLNNDGRKKYDTDDNKMVVETVLEKSKDKALWSGDGISLRVENVKGTAGENTETYTVKRQGYVDIGMGSGEGTEGIITCTKEKTVYANMTRWYCYKAPGTKTYTYQCAAVDSKGNIIAGVDDKLEFALYSKYPEDFAGTVTPTFDKEYRMFDDDQLRAESEASANMLQDEYVYLRVVNHGDKDAKFRLTIKRSTGDINSVQKVKASLGDNQYTKAIGTEYMEISFIAPEDGYYDFALVSDAPIDATVADKNGLDLKEDNGPRFSDDEKPRVLRYYENGIKVVNKKEDPDAEKSYVMEIDPGVKFIAGGKTVVVRNAYPYIKDKRGSVQLKIRKNPSRNVKVLDPNGGKSPNKEAWNNPGYDVFRYDVPERKKDKGYKYQVIVYEWDDDKRQPKIDETHPENNRCYVQGITVRDQDGTDIKNAGVWYDGDKKPYTYISESLGFELSDETDVLYIAVFTGEFHQENLSQKIHTPKDYYVKIKITELDKK